MKIHDYNSLKKDYKICVWLVSPVENISLKYCVSGHHIRLCPQPHCLTGCRTQDKEGQQFHINYQHKVNGQSIEVLAVDILEKSRE